MAAVPLLLAGYALCFALPIVLPRGGSALLYCVLAGGLLASGLWWAEGQGEGGPAAALSESMFFLFVLVTLSGVLTPSALPPRAAGKPIRRAATILAGLALPPLVLLALVLTAGSGRP